MTVDEKLPCGCDNTVSIIVAVEVFVPAIHYNDQTKYSRELIAGAVDELVDTLEWHSIELKDPQPPQEVLNPPHTMHGEPRAILTEVPPLVIRGYNDEVTQ